MLIENTSLNENSKPDEIRFVLKEQSSLVLEYKKKLAKNVPYKLLSSFRLNSLRIKEMRIVLSIFKS